MKEYNIIEAVEYILKNPNAVFISISKQFTIDKHVIEIKDFNEEMFLIEYTLKNSQRTHKEILNNWFKSGQDWMKVESYGEEDKKYFFDTCRRTGDFFNDLEMKTQHEMENIND